MRRPTWLHEGHGPRRLAPVTTGDLDVRHAGTVTEPIESLELTPTALVAGGGAHARGADGRVIFVSGALPGERGRVALRETRRDFARADLIEVIDPSPHRVEPPCPYVAAGCGGCPWQHIDVTAQRDRVKHIS